MLENMLNVAIEAARTAGGIIMDRYLLSHSVRKKGAVDLVTETDLASEEAIRKIFSQKTPGVAVLGEEHGGSLESREAWIVDPLDGTTNYAHRYPMFCVSIAFFQDGRTKLGVVFDPFRNELFQGEEGRGAALNGEALKVSETGELLDSLLATGFPYDRAANPRNNLDAFAKLTLATQGVRRSGSAALDLAYVAAGRLDGFWELGLKPWDTAAGALLVKEAGGAATDLLGEKYVPSMTDIAAANSALHSKLLGALSDAV